MIDSDDEPDSESGADESEPSRARLLELQLQVRKLQNRTLANQRRMQAFLGAILIFEILENIF